MDIIKKNFGECLKNIRKIRNYTQEQLSEKIGINLRQLSRIEAGDSFITSETLYKICTILKVSPWELFNFDIQDNYLMTGTGNVVYLNAIKTGSTRHLVSKQIAESTLKQQNNEEADFDTKMLNMSKSLSKEIIVDEIRDGVYCNTKKYYPNGEIKTENKNIDNDYEKLKNKIDKISKDRDKIAFINLAIDAITSRSALDELKIFIRGIELIQNNI
ncbi:MAG: helix-turn-helix domain-containing protein [bacterium]|nr:helix-turn-helix domain-containing protein [bacterium]